MIYFIPRFHKIVFEDKRFAIITSPRERAIKGIGDGISWCSDNGVFTGNFQEDKFFRFLEDRKKYQSTCLFIACPDMVGDASATLERYSLYAPKIRAMGYKVAFVAQDGQEKLNLPDEYDVLFIGGTTEWKLSDGARGLAEQESSRGKWVHIGRVNSGKRMRYSASIGASSVDGTHIVYQPDIGVQDVIRWLDSLSERK